MAGSSQTIAFTLCWAPALALVGWSVSFLAIFKILMMGVVMRIRRLMDRFDMLVTRVTQLKVEAEVSHSITNF